jgi:hypothetical protein
VVWLGCRIHDPNIVGSISVTDHLAFVTLDKSLYFDCLVVVYGFIGSKIFFYNISEPKQSIISGSERVTVL